MGKQHGEHPVRTIGILLALAGTALLVGPASGLDGFASVKLVPLGAAVAVLLARGGLEVAASAKLAPRWSPGTITSATFAAAGILVAVASPSTRLALAGAFKRWNGVGMYLACVVIFFVAAKLTEPQVVGVLRGFAATAGLVSLQALNEATVGLGDLPVGEFGVASTLGNPNFVSAYAGCAIPVALYGALNSRWTTGWRAIAAASGLLSLVGIAVSRSAQGGLVAGATVLFLGLVAGSRTWPAARVRLVGVAAAAVALLAAGLIGAGASGTGPLQALGSDVGVQHRVYYWRAASAMLTDQPAIGVGPGHFPYHYRSERPLEDALGSSLTDNSDSAHNVPLQMFAEGGLLWGVAYLGWLLAVLFGLVQALRTSADERRLLVGVVGAVWLGYVLQSLISIDVPPLAVLGWASAGVLVALAPPARRTTEIRLPWRPASKRHGTAGGQRVAEVLTLGLAAAVLWFSATPFRADLVANHSGLLDDSNDEGDRSSQIAGWEPEYRLRLVAPLAEQDRLSHATQLAEDAMAVAPLDLEAVLTAARLQSATGDVEAARTSYEQAFRIEPQHPEVATEAAQFALDNGEEAWAVKLLQGVLRVAPEHEEAKSLLTRVK